MRQTIKSLDQKMDTNAVFSIDDLDAVSDLPTLHLSAVIHTLLPTRLIEWKSVKRHFESATAGIKASLPEDSKGDFEFIVTGSAAEGYGLPLVTKRTYPSSMEVLSDVDLLYINKQIPVSTKGIEDHVKHSKVYLEYENVHPGYARICVPRIKEEDEAFVFVEKERKYYLSSVGYLKKMFSTQDKWNLEESTEARVQGPAITLDNHQILTEENMNRPNAGISEDIVCALSCSPWPEIANGIKDRAAKSEWLQTSLIESIISDGCHIVAIPSKVSVNPELEWRLSFSASEGRLAREAVTDQQRQVYVYLKILRYQVMKSQSILSSYIFKCVFLHCCEQIPVNHWKKYPGNCLLYMLDVLLECLRKKHVPTYFLPENNLIDQLSDEELKVAISAVETLRSDPITPVLEFMDDKMFACHCLKLSFRSVIQPLLDDIKGYKQHRNIELSILTGIYVTYYCICISLLKEESTDKEAERMKHQEAIRYSLDLYTIWIEPLEHNESKLKFVNSFGLMIKDTELSMRFFDSMDSLSTEYPEFSLVRGNLACMYHSMAYTHEEDSILRNEYLNKAGELFNQIYVENKGSAIDYVTYLTKQRKFDHAEQILEDILEDESKINNTEYVYDSKELETLDDPLRKYVQENGSIHGDTVSFAYFYMVKCLCVKEQSPLDLIEKFQARCQKMKKENLFILLQLTKALAKMPELTHE